MGPAPRDPTAVLVVSAWRQGAPPRLVARITSTVDTTTADRVTATAAGVDEIVAVVRRWLDEIDVSNPSGDAPVTEA
jgi:hypothetical protein